MSVTASTVPCICGRFLRTVEQAKLFVSCEEETKKNISKNGACTDEVWYLSLFDLDTVRDVVLSVPVPYLPLYLYKRCTVPIV